MKCPVCESDDVWGIEIRGAYDGVLHWHCRPCDYNWHRFPEDHWLHDKADKATKEELGEYTSD